jgi:preprotein translocase subunit SecD
MRVRGARRGALTAAAAAAALLLAACASTPAPATGDLQLRPVVHESPATATSCSGTPSPVPATAAMTACDSQGQLVFSLGPARLTASDVRAVSVASDAPDGSGPRVQVSLDADGTSAFASWTAELARQPAPQNQVAIVVGGRVTSAPYVQESIVGGQLEIAGLASQQDAEALVRAITG